MKRRRQRKVVRSSLRESESRLKVLHLRVGPTRNLQIHKSMSRLNRSPTSCNPFSNRCHTGNGCLITNRRSIPKINSWRFLSTLSKQHRTSSLHSPNTNSSSAQFLSHLIDFQLFASMLVLCATLNPIPPLVIPITNQITVLGHLLFISRNCPENTLSNRNSDQTHAANDPSVSTRFLHASVVHKTNLMEELYF